MFGLLRTITSRTVELDVHIYIRVYSPSPDNVDQNIRVTPMLSEEPPYVHMDHRHELDKVLAPCMRRLHVCMHRARVVSKFCICLTRS